MHKAVNAVFLKQNHNVTKWLHVSYYYTTSKKNTQCKWMMPGLQ